MDSINRKTKPLPILKSSKTISTTKSSSTSSPLSSSSSSTASSTTSSSTSPPTTIQTLIVRPTIGRQPSSSSSTTPPPLPPPLSSSSSFIVSTTTASTVSIIGRSMKPVVSAAAAAAATTTTRDHSHHNLQIPSDILDDLASRFIINVPDDERNNLIRICFQIELAHWFYLDFFCSNDEKKLIPCGMKQFAISLFKHIPFLKVHLSTIDKILEDWKQYKLTVPTYGAILMSEDLKHVLLVQSYWAKSSWGFPKGKVNEHEDPIHCATREVFEETGYDITDLIVHIDYIEAVINYQYTRLYLVRNVPLKTHFMPRTRKEIKCCEWFPIDSLPTNKNDAITKQSLGINANSFFMIMPFIKRLKKWVHENRTTSSETIAAGTTTSTLSLLAAPHSKSKQSSSGSGGNAFNLNSSLLSVAKKLDTKLSFKTTTISGVSNHGASIVAIVPVTTTTAGSNSKATSTISSKRQRHKSMGDLDSTVKFNVNVTGSNNLNKMATAAPKQSTGITTNLISQSPSSQLVDTIAAAEQNSRKYSKSHYKRNVVNLPNTTVNRSKSYRLEGPPAAAAAAAAAVAAASSSSTTVDPISSYPFDLIKQINLETTRPPPQGGSLYRLHASKSSDETSSSVYYGNKTTDPGSETFKTPAKQQGQSLIKRQQNAAQLKRILAESPNFSSWTNFTFTKSLITNVF